MNCQSRDESGGKWYAAPIVIPIEHINMDNGEQEEPMTQ